MSPCRFNVHLLPTLVEPGELAGKTAVVVDVLRATTTIATALAAGAKEIIPCERVEDARIVATQIGPAPLLGGERGGEPIDGFDLGNSPLEYTADRVGGRTIVFTTTNGTRAMVRCRDARRIFLAAHVNYSRVCQCLAECQDVDVVCSGTNGEITREDVLLAGALVHDRSILAGKRGEPFEPNDQAAIALDAWSTALGFLSGNGLLRSLVAGSRGGRNLIELGREHDIEFAAAVDRFDVLPRLDPEDGRIRLA